MILKSKVPDFDQYGLKDDKAQAKNVYANRSDGEIPGVGPKDVVDSSGHRVGKIEEKPFKKPSSRMGAELIQEFDNKKR